jgi:metallo-beta-lactamase family protein
MTDWLRYIAVAPKRVLLTHREPAAADALRRHLDESLHWRCEVPVHFEAVELPRSNAVTNIHPCAATAMSNVEAADPDQLARPPEVP